MRGPEDLTEMRFSKLEVLGWFGDKNGASKLYKCKCDCGNIAYVTRSDLYNGHTKSCGCYRLSILKSQGTHHMSKTRIYKIWCLMTARCCNKKSTSYADYGGRGISICNEWRGKDGFENFLKWSMENGYADNLSIDRINVNGNYEPLNCRWLTLQAQNRNRRSCVYLTYKGETHILTEWAEILGINRSTLSSRYHKGLSVEEMFEPVSR